MTRTYAPSTNPGDTRTRTRYIGIRTPHDAPPQIEILEQEVVRTAAGERVLADLGNVAVCAFDVTESFAVRDPSTDAEIGDTATVGDALVLIYSWVRAKQLARDAAEQSHAEPT
jgi:hypothetical protein